MFCLLSLVAVVIDEEQPVVRSRVFDLADEIGAFGIEFDDG
jgi:hypothetical protein